MLTLFWSLRPVCSVVFLLASISTVFEFFLATVVVVVLVAALVAAMLAFYENGVAALACLEESLSML